MMPSSLSLVSRLWTAFYWRRSTHLGNPVRFSTLSSLLCALAMTRGVAAQSSAADSRPSAAATRPCAPAAAETKPSDRLKPPDAAPANSQKDTLTSCLELRATTLDIQDYLKTMVREKRWTIAQMQTSGDSFSFYRLLDKDELSQVAKTDILGGHITWTEGKAFVMARITNLGDGFARVIISARIQGRGQSSQPFARPSDLWPLVSKGILEGSMIAALESHFHSQR
jgi:hypothetical protein